MGDRPVPVPGIDPMFTDEDLAEILDWMAWEDSLCPGCGHPKHETFDPANEWEYEGVTLACHACSARRRAERHLDVDDGVYSYARRKEVTHDRPHHASTTRSDN